MECFDVYSKHCLQSQKLNMYENKIYRALRLFKKFCANENYQRGKELTFLLSVKVQFV